MYTTSQLWFDVLMALVLGCMVGFRIGWWSKVRALRRAYWSWKDRGCDPQTDPRWCAPHRKGPPD